MWLIFGQLPIKAGWWDAPPALWDFNRSNNHCQSPQLGSQISGPTATEHKYDKTKIENWLPTGPSRPVTNGHDHYTIFNCYWEKS